MFSIGSLMQIKINKSYKSIFVGMEFELPSFTVLTGENGSGKTHLFEAINDRKISQISADGISLNTISYIAFGGLNPQVDNQSDSVQISKKVKDFWQEMQRGKAKIAQKNTQQEIVQKAEQDPLVQYFQNPLHKGVLLNISRQSNVMPSQLTEDIVADNISMLELTRGDIFNTQFALIFKSYHVHYLDNKLKKVYEDEGMVDATPHLSEEEFKFLYGEAPWEFVSSILGRLHLPYKVNNPMGTKRDTTFNFKLIHTSSGREIDTIDLSTGEKTLMSLALVLYNSTGVGNRANILILDEPDAPLHPSMSKIMLEIIEEEIVKKNGVPVILSTHSPTTIALAPANSLYKMTAREKTPTKCNLQDSLKILTYGLPNLRVSTEYRRQVFVEHSYDVIYFESLFDILSRKNNFNTTPQFLPPHTLNGSNCDAVKEITKKLRDMGNTQVYGLIDWDLDNSAEQQIVILGMGNRYAIENYIFEPHFLGLYLIYKKFAKPDELGLNDCNSYLEVTRKIISAPESLQTIVNSIQSKINWGNDNIELTTCTLVNESSLQLRDDLLKMEGHKLEELCKEAWPPLRSIRGNNDGDSALKKDIINTVINDFPELISKDLIDTFNEFK
jgi:predicted ATPase